MKSEDVKKMSVNDYLYGEDHVVDKRGIATSKDYAGPIEMKRTNSVMVPVKRLEEPLMDKFGIIRSKEYQDGIETRQTNSKVLRGKQIRPISFKVDMSTSKWGTPRTFKRFGIELPILFFRGDIFLFVLIFSAVVALIMTLL